jgi:hypothetical protein
MWHTLCHLWEIPKKKIPNSVCVMSAGGQSMSYSSKLGGEWAKTLPSCSGVKVKVKHRPKWGRTQSRRTPVHHGQKRKRNPEGEIVTFLTNGNGTSSHMHNKLMLIHTSI